MFETTLTRLAPFLLLLSLGCHQQGPSLPLKPRPVTSIYSQLAPLPRAVGTYHATVGPGTGTHVQFWYPLASGAPPGNLFLSPKAKDAIHSVAQTATKEQLTEMVESLKKQGITIQPEASAAEQYLLQAMTTRSLEESTAASPSIAVGRFPMIILLHGNGDSHIQYFSSIGENLAAHGFLVTGVQNATRKPDAEPVPGETPEEWQANVFSVIAGLRGKGEQPSSLLAHVGTHVDFDRIGILGHSRGGRVGFLATANQAHPGVLKAGVSLDGPIKSAEENAVTPSPFLFLMLQMKDDAEDHATDRLVAHNNQLPGGATEVLDLSVVQPQFMQAGVGHLNFTDSPLFYNVLTTAVPSTGPTNSNDGFGDMSNEENRRTNSIGFHVFINRTLVDFFNKHL